MLCWLTSQGMLHEYLFVLLCAVISRSVVSDSLQPHGLQHARLLCPWGFYRQEYWGGLPCPPPGDSPNPEIEPRPPAASRVFITWATREAPCKISINPCKCSCNVLLFWFSLKKQKTNKQKKPQKLVLFTFHWRSKQRYSVCLRRQGEKDSSFHGCYVAWAGKKGVINIPCSLRTSCPYQCYSLAN